MVKVGINENVIIVKTELMTDANPSVAIGFKQIIGEELNPFEALQADDIQEENPVLSVRIFSPNVPKEPTDPNKIRTQEETVKMINREVTKVRAQFEHIASQYTTKEVYNLGPFIYLGLDIDSKSYETKMQQPETLKKIFDNMAQQFIKVMSPFVNKEETEQGQNLKMRLLLVRTSKDKHYATLRSKYIHDNPFIESMDIPATASKLAFTAQEHADGLDDATIPTRTDADKTGNDRKEERTAESVFGQ